MQVWSIRLFFIVASTASCYVIYREPLVVLIGLIAALLLVGAETLPTSIHCAWYYSECDRALYGCINFSRYTTPFFQNLTSNSK